MSGILAILNRAGRPVTSDLAEKMLAPASYRGVDGRRIWRDGAVALAHQHFWITPEESGEQQPLVGANGSCAITFDGRIDNRAELLELLRMAGAAGSQLSDAALVLAAYRRWGNETASRLLGDFVFAIWDARVRQLYVARDPLGLRSIAFYADREWFLLGSEIKQILEHPNVRRRLNESKVAEFLAGLVHNHDETFYEDVHYCPPGVCLLVSDQAVRTWRYWDVDPAAKIRYRDDREYAEHFLELTTQAVQSRLRCITPVAVALSGGLDSSFVAAIAARLLPAATPAQGRLKSFSYVFDELRSCDERVYIEQTIARYNIDATYICGDDRWTWRDLDEWPTDPDFVSTDGLASMHTALATQVQLSGCRLVLTGEFGDNLTEGGSYWCAEMLSSGRFGQLLGTVRRHRSSIRWQSDILEHGVRQLIPVTAASAYRRLRPREFGASLGFLEPGFVERTGLRNRMKPADGRRRFPAPGQWPRYRGLTMSLPEQVSAAAQGALCRHGFQLAEPYHDRRLAEFVMAIPADQLGRPYRTRYIQREAMDGIVPDTIRDRTARTVFDPLFQRGLLEKETSRVQQMLQRPQLVQRGFIREQWLEEAQASGGLAHPQLAYPLWLCLCLELWLRRYWPGDDPPV